VLQTYSIDLDAIQTFVFDLDGVVYLGDQAIPGASDSINQLLLRKKNVNFLTNNSSVTRAAYVSKLERMGIVIDQNDVYTSAYATALHLQNIGAAGSNAFVIGEIGVQQEIASIGVNVFTTPNAINSSEIDYVIVGIDRAFSYDKLNFGHECIVRGHAEFIVTNRDTTYPSEIGTVPGAGALVIALASSTAREPKNMGKPEPEALLEIVRNSGGANHSTLMVGDRLDTDIACGNRAGVPTALVLTGVTTKDDAEVAQNFEKPALIIGTLADLL
jgi:phosphoglycolate/pyridoxal phosphate phosphatase family enzyme